MTSHTSTVTLIAIVAPYGGRYRVFVDARLSDDLESAAWATMAVVRGRTAIVRVFSLWSFTDEYARAIAIDYMTGRLEKVNLNDF